MLNHAPIADYRTVERISLEISKLRCECFAWSHQGSKTVGSIRFVGKYRFGSDGADDARFIHWKLIEFCDCRTPLGRIDALLVDFRDLDYEWGDDLSVTIPDVEIPTIVVITSAKRTAFGGVLGAESLRDDFESAITEVENLAITKGRTFRKSYRSLSEFMADETDTVPAQRRG